MVDLNDINYKPSIHEIDKYIGNALFDQLFQFMNDEYKALCKIEYSKDVWFPGWIIKLPLLSKEIRDIYYNTKEGMGQRWLMIDLHSDNSVYQDVLKLIRIRRGSK